MTYSNLEVTEITAIESAFIFIIIVGTLIALLPTIMLWLSGKHTIAMLYFGKIVVVLVCFSLIVSALLTPESFGPILSQKIPSLMFLTFLVGAMVGILAIKKRHFDSMKDMIDPIKDSFIGVGLFFVMLLVAAMYGSGPLAQSILVYSQISDMFETFGYVTIAMIQLLRILPWLLFLLFFVLGLYGFAQDLGSDRGLVIENASYFASMGLCLITIVVVNYLFPGMFDLTQIIT